MAVFIILNAAQADQVRGPSAADPWATLDPASRQGGKFILGVRVLTDPAHEAHRQFLATLPQQDINDPAFPPEIEPVS